MTLRIDNFDDFLAAEEEVKSEAVRLSGFEWFLTAQLYDKELFASIECITDAVRWHCKANYIISLRSTKEADRVLEARKVFDDECYGRGFSEMVTLRVSVFPCTRPI